jgi:DNA-binding CsgD family transcriptional regulator
MTDSLSHSGSITKLLRQLPSKDEQVVQDVFNFYFSGLVRRAKSLLTSMGGVKTADEEDLAILVITAFLSDATEGELGDLRSRHDVWRMLSKRIRLRAINMVRDERRSKKNEVGESVFIAPNGALAQDGIAQHPGRNIEDLRLFHSELVDMLSDPVEREIAALLLEGKEVIEIVEQLGKSPATVYRKLRGIRESWDRLTTD